MSELAQHQSATNKGSLMARKKKHQPTDPAEIARRAVQARKDPAKWGANREAMSLPSNADLHVEAETRQKVERIQRYDVFALLHTREAISSDALAAVRRLQDDLAKRLSTEGATTFDGAAGGPGSRAHVTDRSIQAAELIEQITALMADAPWRLKLIMALIEPGVVRGERTNWRNTVRAMLGETRPPRQVEFVAVATRSLSEAYRNHDNSPRKKAA